MKISASMVKLQTEVNTLSEVFRHHHLHPSAELEDGGPCTKCGLDITHPIHAKTAQGGQGPIEHPKVAAR